MKVLTTITTQDINPDAPSIDHANFSRRYAVRAVVVDEHNRVALLDVSRQGYHKLPGGGIDVGETMDAALQRELLEEIGSHADSIAEIGEIHEFWDEERQMQTSYCYLVRQKGEQQDSNFTDEERQRGFRAFWTHSIDEAIAILKADRPTGHAGRHIVPRDLLFLETAKGMIDDRSSNSLNA